MYISLRLGEIWHFNLETSRRIIRLISSNKTLICDMTFLLALNSAVLNENQSVQLHKQSNLPLCCIITPKHLHRGWKSNRCAGNWVEKVAPSYDVFVFINQNFAGALGERNKAVSSQHLLCESSKAIGGMCATLFDLALSSYNCIQ